MLNLKFGIEIEFCGISRKNAADILRRFFDSSVIHVGEELDEWIIGEPDGKLWRIVRDSSIDSDNEEFQCELVTPILQYEEVEEVLVILGMLSERGAIVNHSCGMHIHVDAQEFTPQALVNLIALVGSNEAMIYKALEIDRMRLRYCKRVNEAMITDIKNLKPKDMEQFRKLWYMESPYETVERKYHSTRYHGINLHAVFTHGTVEFRLFNSTLNPVIAKSYLQFVLCICSKAITQKKAVIKKVSRDNEKYIFRSFLIRLGMVGEEYKDCRRLLLGKLAGDCAWRD